MNPSNSIDDTHTIKNSSKKVFYELITDIDSINKDSPIALLNALYQCEDYILLDENEGMYGGK